MQNPLINPELERALLSILLIDPDAYATAGRTLHSTDFGDNRNAMVFAAIEQVAMQGKINYVSVANKLEAQKLLDEIGGATYLSDLVGFSVPGVPIVGYLDQYTEKVRALSQRRALLSVADKLARDVHDMSTP